MSLWSHVVLAYAATALTLVGMLVVSLGRYYSVRNKLNLSFRDS